MIVFALSGTDSDSDLELPNLKKMKKKQKISQENEDVNDSDIASDDPEEDEDDVRRWGTKKKHYYGGNTGEEIEDDLDESNLEEDKMEEVEAAKLQSRQLQMMEEEDFLDTFVPKTSEKKAESQKVSVDAVTKDFSKLSSKEQSNLFRQQNPEFDGVVADFNSRMKEAVKLSKIVSLAEAGEGPSGTSPASAKLTILLSFTASFILMLKSATTPSNSGFCCRNRLLCSLADNLEKSFVMASTGVDFDSCFLSSFLGTNVSRKSSSSIISNCLD